MINGGILTDGAIRRAVRRGDIEIEPFNDAHVNSGSYDLTLGDEVAVYSKWVYSRTLDLRLLHPESGLVVDGIDFEPRRNAVIDVAEEPRVDRFRIGSNGFVLRKGIGYLMHTVERVHTRNFVPVLDGKSSNGRLFMQVHETAGYGDAGFNGQYTLEVSVKHDLRIRAGMRIAQIRFETMHGELEKPYAGRYVGEHARGPAASRAWMAFQTKG
jgi:dCTP deaminase